MVRNVYTSHLPMSVKEWFYSITDVCECEDYNDNQAWAIEFKTGREIVLRCDRLATPHELRKQSLMMRGEAAWPYGSKRRYWDSVPAGLFQIKEACEAGESWRFC